MSADRIARARARLAVLVDADRDDPRVAHPARGWIPDAVAPVAVVLLHGLTNAPPQYDLLAWQLVARGHAVIVPRMPYHGYRDRMTRAIAKLEASDVEAASLEAVAIAALCGERIVVLGISVGAAAAGWLAARTAIDTAIAVAPFCGLRELAGTLNDALGTALRTLPNWFGWWDPRAKERQPPPHGYPRFTTHALGSSLLISTQLATASAAGAHARRAVLVCNDHEPVVNNAFAARRFAELARLGVRVENVVLHGLPHVHDIIEPAIPQARTDLVYPTLIALIEES